MSIGARLNHRITMLAVGNRPPRRTVRVRLTLLYGALFLLSGAALMAITYVLLVNAGFVFTLQNGSGNQAISGSGSPVVFPAPGSSRPSPRTMAHWRSVAQCIRRHGVSGFPNPTTSVTPDGRYIGELSDRDGAMFAIPTAVLQVPAFSRVSAACGFVPDLTNFAAVESRRRTQTRQQLLLQSGIALALMSLLSLGVGWLMAGRVIAPLEQAYESQRQFVANASHELRAPLTRQRALIQVALADPGASFGSLRTAHERVLASEHHLEQMIDGLLALTRGQAGLERREQLDLAVLASEAILARERELDGFDVRAALEPAPIAGDPRLLERLLSNLIDNAISYNAPGRQVEITTGTRDRRALASVANSGPAVPPDQIKRLFEPFQRLDGARTSHNSGQGLGLSIVQAIAGAHRADLTARARSEGGMTFEVAFPLARTPGASLAPARTAPANPRISGTDAPVEG